MKKTTLLLAICFAFQFNATSQVLVPDTEFEQALLDFNIDTDMSLNGQISNVDAEAVTGTLTLINRNITDLTGIEGFTNITGLNVSYNLLTSLDLRFNTNLTFVDTEENNALATIDISGLTNLVTLNFWDNDLSVLDVSANPNLETLVVRQNNIAVLDLSNNSALTVLNARSNLLTDLDMRNGTNASITSFNSDFNGSLTCIFVDDASAGYLATWSKDAVSTYVNDQAECNTLTVEDQNQTVFNMYPNPVKNTVFVSVNTQDSQLSIYDITGKLVLNKSLSLGENAVDVSQMSTGVYLARFAANGKVQTEKLIIQ